MGRYLSVAFLVLAALIAGTLRAAGPAYADGLEPSSFPVIAIHGYDSRDCPGSDASYGWRPLDSLLRSSGYTGPLLPVSFYTCDTNGADITGYGADTPVSPSSDITAGPTRAGYDQNVSLATVAHDLAWYIYRNFTARGKPVNLISLSMGGLIARAALTRVQRGDPSFPPQLLVAQSITFSTPHLGFGTVDDNAADSGCRRMLQCTEWATNAPLMTELMRDGADPQGAGGTQWILIGSSAGCDILPVASAFGLRNAIQIDLTKPCYSHIGYMLDAETTRDATATVRFGADATPFTLTDAPHSLMLAAYLMSNPPGQAPAPAPQPAPTAFVTQLPEVTTTPTVAVQFGSDASGGSYDLRYRVASGADAAGAWITPDSLRGLGGGSATLTPPSGTTQYCVSARVTSGGVTSDWSTATCTAMTIDDRKLSLSSGWTSTRSPGSVADAVSVAKTTGRTATLTVQARTVALVVTTCATCGTVQILVDGQVWRTVSTASSATAQRTVLLQPGASTARIATVTVRTTSAKPVYLDGLAAVR